MFKAINTDDNFLLTQIFIGMKKFRLSYELSNKKGEGCKNIHCSLTFAEVMETIKYYLERGWSIHHLTMKSV